MKRVALLAVVLCAVLSFGRASYAFREDFNTLDSSRWVSFQRGGQLSVSGGQLHLSAGSARTCPFMYLTGNPFPSSRDFTIRMGIRFSYLGGAGSGICTDTGIPGFQGIVYRADINSPFEWWGGKDGIIYTGQGSAQRPWFYLPCDTAYHDIAFSYQNNHVTLCIDGIIRSSFDSFRPTALWIGNPSEQVGQVWSAFDVDYIEVTAVPEPSSIIVLACGIATIGSVMRRKRG